MQKNHRSGQVTVTLQRPAKLHNHASCIE